MSNIRKHTTPPATPGGIRGELRRLGTNGSASVDELRDFIGQMHGKRPEEVLGAVASSNLVQSTLIATAGIAVVLIVFTAVPYFLSGSQEEATAAPGGNQAAAEAEPESGADAADSKTPAAQNGSAQAAADQSAESTSTSGDPLLDNLGIGETKTAAPDKNPLDNNLDKLLDGIDE